MCIHSGSQFYFHKSIIIPIWVHMLPLFRFEIMTPDGNKVHCRVSVAAFTCDLPTRAMVMNMVQYNGFYGCSHCKQKG